MSEFKAEVVQVPKLEKHPNADMLSIVKIHDYTVVVRTDDWHEGDLAVYIPIDSICPQIPLFQFLGTKGPEFINRPVVVKAKRLRGVLSYGCLVPLESLKPYLKSEVKVGDNVAPLLGIKKYEPPEEVEVRGGIIKNPPWFQKYTDIENARKYSNVLKSGENVVIHEKIHGSSSFYCINEGKLWLGSHRFARDPEDDNMWSVIAKRYNMFERIKKIGENKIVYGESVGNQKGFSYGRKQVGFAPFDIFDIAQGKYLDHDEFVECVRLMDLTPATLLYRGPWQGLEFLEEYADGQSVFGGDHIREGVVVKPTTERWDKKLGRVILKMHGEGYLLGKKKGKKKK